MTTIIDLIIQERTAYAKLNNLLDAMNWHQKMAVGQLAYNMIDSTENRILNVEPVNLHFDDMVKEITKLLRILPPETLAEIACDIVQGTFENRNE
jgi:hypothetical protein